MRIKTPFSIVSALLVVCTFALATACGSSQEQSGGGSSAKKSEQPTAKKRSMEQPAAKNRSVGGLGAAAVSALNNKLSEVSISGYKPYHVGPMATKLDPYMNIISEVAKAVPAGYVLQVTGHANANKRRSERYWVALSKRRAYAIYSHLLKKGMPKDKLSYKGVGSSEPAVEGWNEANRRVTFKVVQQ